jgi:hypothetical protein
MRILFDIYISCYLQNVLQFWSFAHSIITSASTMATFQFEYIKIEYFDSVALKFYDI